MLQWVEMYNYCHNQTILGDLRWCYPNGLSLVEQPYYVVDIFNIISEQLEILKVQAARKPPTGM